ncbi:MAG: hypothetical protein Q9220_007444 [cf. Caloplaca sp. 1 TL-2023]
MTETCVTSPTKITFRSPGASPPIYVAGDFTSPAWHPYELEFSVPKHDGEHLFFRSFDLAQGTYQYKFRFGHQGDWWVCDDTIETVTDALGHRNNLLIVSPRPLNSTKPDSEAVPNTGTPNVKDAQDNLAGGVLPIRTTSSGVVHCTRNSSEASHLEQCLIQHAQNSSAGATGQGNNTGIVDEPFHKLAEVRSSSYSMGQEDSLRHRRKRRPSDESSSTPSSSQPQASGAPAQGFLRRIIRWITSLFWRLFGDTPG